MGILKELDAIVKKAANSKELLNTVRMQFPVNEFTVESAQYKEFVELLESSGNSDLVKNVFEKGNVLQDKVRADWGTIEQLTLLYASTPQVKVDKDIQKVYIRLAALAKGISGEDKKIVKKLGGRSASIQKVFGLLTNTQALRSLIDSNVKVSGTIKETAKDRTATIGLNYTQILSSGTKDLLGTFTRFTSKKLADGLEQQILNRFINLDFSKIGTPELTERFFNKAVRELDEKLASKIPEFEEIRKFNTTKLAILTAATKAELRKVSNEAKKVKKALDTASKRAKIDFAESPASLVRILNANMRPALEGFGGFQGTMKQPTDPSSKNYLRHQTNTFSKSVEAKTALITGNMLNVTFDYKRDPYEDLYTRGGKYAGSGNGVWWSDKGRDVEYIAGQAIEDIARKFISANLTVNTRPI